MITVLLPLRPCKSPALFAPILLALSFSAAGCTGLLPKTVTQEGLTPQIKKRNEAATQYFAEQRDLAEYEAAKNCWEQQHDAKGCRDGLEKLLARNPKHHDARLLMVEVLSVAGDSQEAYRHAKAALDVWPNDAAVQFTMATTLDALGRTADALSYYQRAATMAPRNESFQVAYQAAREASREEVRDRHARTSLSADATVEKAMPVGYTTTAAKKSRATERGDLADCAEFADPVDDDPDAIGCQAADTVRPSEKKPELPQKLSDSHTAQPNTDELLRAGQAALSRGDDAAATECFRQAEALQPENSQIPVSIAAAALRANRADVAIAVLKPAAKRFPNAAAVHRMLGAAYYRGGDYPSSQVALRQALSLDKSSALSYLLMGYTLTKLGQKEAAESHFRQAKALDPRYAVAR